ncbi:MAG: carbon-nitrogen family hydrolase [Promethearchaeota archaeon]
MDIALIQMEIEDGNKEKNINNALEILKFLENSINKPDVVCFPELFTSGYDLRNVKKLAEKIPGPTIEKISEISKNNFIVLGTILEKKDDRYYNTAFILSKNGQIIGKYSKIHLFSPMLEKEFLTPGNEINIFTLTEFNNLKIGITICYDLRFPELFRILTLKGAQIIFVPSEFPSPKSKTWLTLIKARAIENQVYIIGTNRVGKGNSDTFFGNSIVTNGEYSEILGNQQEIKIYNIDLESLDKIRQKLPLLKDRRSDLY